jgi:hypothetical protein
VLEKLAVAKKKVRRTLAGSKKMPTFATAIEKVINLRK